MMGLALADFRDRTRWARFADGVALALVISLPWSTSATSILAAVWLVAVIPATELTELRRVVKTPSGALPLIFLALGIAGMLWADVSWRDRLHGVEDFAKFLVIPLMMARFSRSEHGMRVFIGFLLSCTALLLLSSVFAIWPETQFMQRHDFAVPVKNASIQSGEFLICIFGILFVAIDLVHRRRFAAAALCGALAAGFALNILYVATSRTVLVIFPVLLVLFGYRKFGWKGVAGMFGFAIVVLGIAWSTSPYLRSRTSAIVIEYQQYRETNTRTSTGERIEFWKKSVEFVASAPLFGHGTGSIQSQFRESAIGQSGTSAVATKNPHNQTFATAIQIGLIGAAVMWAMWIAHLLLFRGSGLVGWIGMVVVVQNVVGSVFNSHLFDFVQGWTYVIGVGVAGGMVMAKLKDPKNAG